MPLARITTPLPEYYERLAQDLRARGFDVETASPGQFFSAAADLEITVKQCRPEDAAKLAADASGTKDMCVLITPGAKSAGIRTIEMIVLQPKAEAQAVRNLVTPSQVIEISSALVQAAQTQALPHRASGDAKPKNLPRIKTGARENWDEILRTTTRWMDTATTGCRAGWVTVKESLAPLKAFLLEVCDETRNLARRTTTAMVARWDRKKSADEQERLVPSMYGLSEEEPFPGETQMAAEANVIPIAEPRRGRAGGRRFWKAANAAAVVAVAVLLAVSLRHRAPRPAAESSSVIKGNVSAPAASKSSALIERAGQKAVANSGLHMIASKQVIPVGSEVDDTVVRYVSRPLTPKRPDSHPQIKRYSDLD